MPSRNFRSSAAGIRPSTDDPQAASSRPLHALAPKNSTDLLTSSIATAYLTAATTLTRLSQIFGGTSLAEPWVDPWAHRRPSSLWTMKASGKHWELLRLRRCRRKMRATDCCLLDHSLR